MKKRPGQDSLCIRSGAFSDLPVVKALYGQLSTDPRIVDSDFRSIVGEPNSGCLMMEIGSSVVGMAIFHFATSLSLGRSMQVEELVIDENHRCEGLGSLLVEHLMRMARERGGDSISLSCSRSNERLHRFHEPHRFSHRMRQYSYIPALDDSGRDGSAPEGTKG